MSKHVMVRAVALAATLAAAPLVFSPTQGVVSNDACAQVKLPGTGTCCPQMEAMCITPTGNVSMRYYKSEGPC